MKQTHLLGYKYRGAGRMDLIRERKFLFQPYHQFNDPFECRFVLNPPPNERARAELDGYHAEWAEVKVWTEGRIGQLGILCLSKVRDSILMWSHYADNHRGFVAGFDLDHSFFRKSADYIDPTYRVKMPFPEPGFGTLREVVYSNQRRPIELGEGVPWDAFFTKSTPWRYEKELRIFRTLGEADSKSGDRHFFTYPPEMLRVVVLGANAGRELREEIRAELSKPEMAHVKLLQAKLHPRRFKLTIALA
jgi:hypothetical protein